MGETDRKKIGGKVMAMRDKSRQLRSPRAISFRLSNGRAVLESKVASAHSVGRA